MIAPPAPSGLALIVPIPPLGRSGFEPLAREAGADLTRDDGRVLANSEEERGFSRTQKMNALEEQPGDDNVPSL